MRGDGANVQLTPAPANSVSLQLGYDIWHPRAHKVVGGRPLDSEQPQLFWKVSVNLGRLDSMALENAEHASSLASCRITEALNPAPGGH